MAKPVKVRLVRCPKCKGLLPENTDHPVYECGGCGAVLRAKNRKFAADALSKKSDEERVEGVSEKIPEKSDNCNFLEKGMNLSDGPENDVRSNASYRTADQREVLSDMVDKQRNGSSFNSDKWFIDKDLERKENLYESTAEMGKKSEELKAPKGITNASQRSGQFADCRSREENELGEFWRKPRRDVQGKRILSSKYSEDGPSNYDLRSSYDHGELGNNQNKPDEFNKVECLEQDRAELLRKLDELKNQLSRFCDVNGEPKGKAPLDWRLDCQEEPHGGDQRKTFPWYPGGSWRSNRASSDHSVSDPYAARPPYGGHYPEQLPYMNGARAHIAGTAKLAADLVPFFGLMFSLFSMLITLMQIKYLNGHTSPYITNPSSMAICLVALCIFAFAVGFKMVRQILYGHSPAHITNRVILISGALVVVAIVSIIVTHRLSWIIYIIWAIFSVMVVAWNWIHIINPWRLYERIENAFFGVINVFGRFQQRLPMISAGRKLLAGPQGPSNV